MLANDRDSDVNALSVLSVTDPPNGSATISGGWVMYTPDSGFSGTDSFSYTISDGKGGQATATVTVSVKTLPPPPTSHTMTVNSATMSGKSTSGLYTVIRQGSTAVKTGFTPSRSQATQGRCIS